MELHCELNTGGMVDITRERKNGLCTETKTCNGEI